MNLYQELTKRNQGYIAEKTQKRIQTQRLLVAGCGIGSQIALAAVRLGFEHFVLVDGDQVALHNLNRQGFDFSQIEWAKPLALAEQLRRINPNVQIQAHCEHLGPANAERLVSSSDFVIDTIDFLDMQALLLLHGEAVRQKKPAISSFSVGWGAAAMYFPNREGVTDHFRTLFVGDDAPSSEPLSYVLKFRRLFELMSPHLNPIVVRVMNETFQSMMDNRPCPAPQVAAGAFAVASLVTTMLVQILSSVEPKVAPELILFDLWTMTKTSSLGISSIRVDLATAPSA